MQEPNLYEELPKLIDTALFQAQELEAIWTDFSAIEQKPTISETLSYIKVVEEIISIENWQLKKSQKLFIDLLNKLINQVRQLQQVLYPLSSAPAILLLEKVTKLEVILNRMTATIVAIVQEIEQEYKRQKQEQSKAQLIRCKCGNCGKFSQMKLLSLYNHIEEHEDEQGHFEGISEHLLRLLYCPRCDSINFTEEEDGDEEPNIVWPTKSKESQEIIQLKEQLATEQQKHAAEVEQLKQQLQEANQKSLAIVQTEFVEGEVIPAIIPGLPKYKLARLQQYQQYEIQLDELLNNRAKLNRLLSVTTNPTDYTRLQIDMEHNETEIKRIEKALEKLEK